MDRRKFIGLMGSGIAATGIVSVLPGCSSKAKPGQAAAGAPTNQPVQSIEQTESPAERDARMAWWRDARFGMFIHWGLYAELAGVYKGKHVEEPGEWIMNHAKIPVAQYEALAAHFDPTKFNADQWVELAREAGQKYMVITSKHHDGFAMFNSPANHFNIVDATPFKRDPLKELAIAAQKQKVKFGFYYSQNQDWTAPGGRAYGGHWDPAQDGSFDKYLQDKAIPQIKELLTNYEQWGAPSEIWFDTPQGMTPDQASQIIQVMNQHPNIVYNNRLGGGYPGYFETPEQHIPPQGFPGKDWETCMTINNTWGYVSWDQDFKSVQTLLQNLIDIASKGGNYLLNVGPEASGIIPKPEQDRLLAMGKWLKVNGDAIYGTTAGPFSQEHGAYSSTKKDQHGKPVWVPVWDWRATQKPGKVYVSIFNWHSGAYKLPALKEKVTRASLLAKPHGNAIKVTQDAAGLTLTLPAHAPDPIASVVVLDI